MLCRWESITGNLVLKTELKTLFSHCKEFALHLLAHCSDEGIMLETSALTLTLTVANLHFQLSC